jgi:hypothetical protein
MGAALSSEISVYVYQIMQHHIPDDSNNHSGTIDYGMKAAADLHLHTP